MKGPCSRLPFGLTDFRAICHRRSTLKRGASARVSGVRRSLLPPRHRATHWTSEVRSSLPLRLFIAGSNVVWYSTGRHSLSLRRCSMRQQRSSAVSRNLSSIGRTKATAAFWDFLVCFALLDLLCCPAELSALPATAGRICVWLIAHLLVST